MIYNGMWTEIIKKVVGLEEAVFNTDSNFNILNTHFFVSFQKSQRENQAPALICFVP